jgi:hypothetical protein
MFHSVTGGIQQVIHTSSDGHILIKNKGAYHKMLILSPFLQILSKAKIIIQKEN